MLRVVATPIGNLGDVSERAVRSLREADVLACEDTRRTRVIFSHFGIKFPSTVISYREGVEEKAGEKLVRFLQEGKNVVLCSDGGYPGISDPGYRLINKAVESGIDIEVIPGASAVPVALLMSGLSAASYTFKGFPPRKEGALKRFFEEEKDMCHTLVIFESPFRVFKTLKAAFEILGDRKAAVCVEMTKKFEKVSRGFLKDLVSEYDGKKVKGEVTIVVAGNNPKFVKKTSELEG